MGLAEGEPEMEDVNGVRPGRSRDLFGVQLEVRETNIFASQKIAFQRFLRYQFQLTIIFIKKRAGRCTKRKM